jgi:methionyl-tRNA formyltransferase
LLKGVVHRNRLAMRIAFMGTPDFARVALDALVEAGHDIAAVYTQPPRPANRGRLTPSPVHLRAEALGLPVRTPERLREPADQAAFAELGLDVAVVAAYGLLLPQAVLDAPRLGCLNIHASLLPRWRGAAPIQRAILAGDTETGVTIMQMEKGLDTGPMLKVGACPIGRETAGDLTAKLAELGARLMVETLAALPCAATPQPDAGVTYAHKIDKAEARIDWAQPARHLDRLVRAMQPSPGAWFDSAGQRVKLIAAEPADGAGTPGTLLADTLVAAGAGALRLLTVQPEGKPRMAAEDWLRGRRLDPGAPL